MDADDVIGLVMRTGLPESELTQLPDALLDQLRPKSGRGVVVAGVVRALGGAATIDQIIVHIYRTRGEIWTRPEVNACCYRLEKAGFLHSSTSRPKRYRLTSLFGKEEDA